MPPSSPPPTPIRSWASPDLLPGEPTGFAESLGAGALRAGPGRSALAGQEGQALVLFTLFFTVILGMAALVLDQGLLRKTNLDLHNALDSGALAGVAPAQGRPGGGRARGPRVRPAELPRTACRMRTSR